MATENCFRTIVLEISTFIKRGITMKYKVLGLLMFFLLYANTMAQNSFYSLSRMYKLPELKLMVYLFDNHMYNIEMQTLGIDLIWRYHISQGTYRINNDTIIFKDNILEVELVAVFTSTKFPLSQNGIEFIKGYDFLRNLFVPLNEYINPKDSKDEYNNLILYNIENSKSIIKQYDKRLSKDVKSYDLNLGYYSLGVDFTLEFKDEQTYVYYFRNNIVSNGNWARINNTIELRDPNFPKKFILYLVDNNKFTAIKLPLLFWGDFDSRIFNLDKKE